MKSANLMNAHRVYFVVQVAALGLARGRVHVAHLELQRCPKSASDPAVLRHGHQHYKRIFDFFIFEFFKIKMQKIDDLNSKEVI